MTKILLHAHIPEQSDGTSWYRGSGPLLELQREHRDEIEIKFFTGNDSVDWYHLADAQLTFIQRPFHPKCADFFGVGKMFGAKCIADWDDHFDDVHVSNPVRSLYENETTRAVLKGLYANIDMLWTTTGFLAQGFKMKVAKPDEVHVIPNAWNTRVFPFAKPSESSTIMWRGGHSHLGDMLEFAPEFRKVVRALPLWHYEVMGEGAWPFEQIIPAGKLQKFGWLPTPLYLRAITGRNPAVIIVPLEQTSFNRAKSNIAWLEGAAAGAITVAPDWPEWQRPGVVHYRSSSDFADAVKRACAMSRKQRAELVIEAQAHITNQLSLQVQNKRRLELIKKLAAQ